MDTLLPILKHKSELALQQGRGMYVDYVIDKPSSPLVMYGVDSGGAMAYSPSEGEESDLQKKADALVNLWSLDVPYTLHDADGTPIAVAEHEYAAEKILDPLYLIAVANALQSDEIVVGIPAKGVLIVGPKACAAGVHNAARNLYERNNTYPISDAIFLVVNGAVLAISAD